jgi:hypothetical protein
MRIYLSTSLWTSSSRLAFSALFWLILVSSCAGGAEETDEPLGRAAEPSQAAAAPARVDGGGNHSLVLRADGSVWAFGGNASGQLGDG